MWFCWLFGRSYLEVNFHHSLKTGLKCKRWDGTCERLCLIFFVVFPLTGCQQPTEEGINFNFLPIGKKVLYHRKSSIIWQKRGSYKYFTLNRGFIFPYQWAIDNLCLSYYDLIQAGAPHISDPEQKERFESSKTGDKFHMLIVFSQIYWYCSWHCDRMLV